MDPLCIEAQELDDFEPQPRDRSNTWPLQKPSGDNFQTSPLIHEEIPEVSESGENSAYGSHEALEEGDDTLDTDSSGLLQANNKKNTSRRNAWGNLSYADLITQAILNSPEKRLTLSQIYDWMVQNVPYFRDKGDSNSSAGWKNSIRHNLSLHNRFMRIQNEGAGKSSWWVINPDAKPGKSSRRRAGSMETKTLEKKRGRAKKKVEQLRMENGMTPAFSESSDLSSAFSLSPSEFRARSDSNVSNFSTASFNGTHSPLFEEDYEHPVGTSELSGGGGSELFPDLAETMTATMNLGSAPDSQRNGFQPNQSCRNGANLPAQKSSYIVATISGQHVYLTPSSSPGCGNPISPLASPVKLVSLNNGPNHRNSSALNVECNQNTVLQNTTPSFVQQPQSMSPVLASHTVHQHHAQNATPPYTIKQEPHNTYIKQEPVHQPQPPAYQELYPVHLNQHNGLTSNPILRDALIQKCGTAAQLQNQLHHNATMAQPLHITPPCYYSHGNILPTELSDISYNTAQSSDFSSIDIAPYLQSISGGGGEFDINFGNINL